MELNHVMRVYYQKHANPGFLQNKNILVLGYGNQGKAFANNLRDSGFEPTICLHSGSKSKTKAVDDGFAVITPSRINSDYELILFMIPDHIQADFYEKYLESKTGPGTALVFAHGYAVYFRLLHPPQDCDVVLLAPHGPGSDLRRLYLDDDGLSGYVAVEQDFSGNALKLALALARAVGITRRGAFLTSFEHETLGDLFGEQALLCGGLSELCRRSFDTLVDAGLPKENAYLETIHQIDLLAGLIKRYGVTGMMEKISTTAGYGISYSRPVIFDRKFDNNLKRLYSEIDSGKFTRSWQAEYRNGSQNLKRYKREVKESEMEKTGRKLRKKLSGNKTGGSK
ncbi:MAG: ketol-acid reductoisomerase [candidate division Zixibacteria bacterium]|nr:ketol-acid reductoisomerase [candidate division Zixibacteria bacterium]